MRTKLTLKINWFSNDTLGMYLNDSEKQKHLSISDTEPRGSKDEDRN